MKAIKYFASALALLVLAVSCKEEEIKPGKKDAANCPGVYIPQQTNAGSHTFAPEDEAVLTFVAKRGVEEGALVIPPVVTDTSAEKILKVDDIVFEDGQTEASFSVRFDDAALGTTYAFTIALPDSPEIVSIYSSQPTSISFSVTRAKYVPAGLPAGNGIGKWRDDIFGDAIGTYAGGNKNPEWDVKIEMREDQPGRFYVRNMFCYDQVKDYFSDSQIAQGYPEDATEEGVDVIIDATNPNKVYIATFDTGWQFYEDGTFGAESICAENGWTNPDSWKYGTLKDGIITFPVQGLAYSFSGTPWNYSNKKGLLRIILPGYKASDFSLSVSSEGLTQAGKHPIAFSLGADIDSVAYCAYPGALDEAAVAEKAGDLAKGKDENAKSIKSGDPTNLEFEFDETGEYTIVAVGFDVEKAAQASASVSFNYVAPSDPRYVDLTAGVELTNRHAKQGLTTENSIGLYAFGTDIAKAQCGIFKYVDIAADPAAAIADLKENEDYALPAEAIEAINGDGLDTMIGGLIPGTKFVLFLYADNSYQDTLITLSFTTAGDPLPVYDEYGVADMIEGKTLQDYVGTFNYYAIDLSNTLGLREYLGQVKSVASAKPDTIEVSGMLPCYNSEGVKLDYDDTVEWAFYQGFLYNVCSLMPDYAATYPTIFTPFDYEGGLWNFWDGALIGGYVKDGYIAFTTTGYYEQKYADSGVEPLTGIGRAVFADLTFNAYFGPLCVYTDLLLVDPEKDNNGLAPAPSAVASARKAIGNVRKMMGTKLHNKVETPKGRFQSAVDAARKAARAQGRITGLKAGHVFPARVKGESFRVSPAAHKAAPKTSVTAPVRVCTGR